MLIGKLKLVISEIQTSKIYLKIRNHAMKKEWTFEVNGNTHNIRFFPNIWRGQHRLIIDGEETKVKRSKFQIIRYEDIPIIVGGEECRFILLGLKADVVFRGVCLGSKKKYKAVKGIPWWTWIFIIICLSFPSVCFDGVLEYLLGIPGAYLCARVAISPYTHVILRIIVCYLIMVYSAVFCVYLGIVSGVIRF